MNALNLYQCSHWTGRVRCEAPGTLWLNAPDGKRVPGPPYCERHALATVTEYAAKLGETWTTENVYTPTNDVDAFGASTQGRETA